MEYYSAIKRNKSLEHETTSMNLKSMLNGTQTPKIRLCNSIYMKFKKGTTTVTESRLVTAKNQR